MQEFLKRLNKLKAEFHKIGAMSEEARKKYEANKAAKEAEMATKKRVSKLWSQAHLFVVCSPTSWELCGVEVVGRGREMGYGRSAGEAVEEARTGRCPGAG